MKWSWILVAISGWISTISKDDPLVVIVNSENEISGITLTEARGYWMRRPKKRWDKIDKDIKPVDRKDVCENKNIFYERILKMKEEIVESYFTARQYQNGELPPGKLGSDKEIIDFISKESGGIGYVRRSSLDSEGTPKVKIVFTLEE